VLSSHRETLFVRLAGFDTLPVTSEAVAANGVGTKSGGQLVALDPTSCGAGKFRGNGTVDVAGSIYVNSDGSGPPPCINAFDNACSGTAGAFQFEGNLTRLVTPQLSVRGTCGQNANPYPNNCVPPSSCGITEGAPQIVDPINLPEPGIPAVPGQALHDGANFPLTDCDQPTDDGCSFNAPGVYEVWPGTYYGGWVNITREVRLHPGLYYFAGGGIVSTGGEGRIVTIDDNGLANGDGRVLLFSTDGPQCAALGGRKCQGPILIEGQGGFQARGYEAFGNADPTDDGYHRLLVWQAECVVRGANNVCLTPSSKVWPADTDFLNDRVRIAGQGDLCFWGTMYAPKSLVELQGQGTGTGSGSCSGSGQVAGVEVLAWRFDVGGNANLSMPYDPGELAGITFKGLVE
jgi:hypothetical protein